MAFFDSSVSKFKITDTGATLRDISAYITDIDGLPGLRDLNDATTLNQGGTMWQPTIEKVVITLGLLYSRDALVGPDTVLGPLRTYTAAVAFEYWPEGDGASKVKYTGNVWVRNYTIQSKVAAIIAAKCELPVNGQVTRTLT